MTGIVLNKKRLFAACCLALVVTAMTFSIRANLLGSMGTYFSLSPRQMGEVSAAAFWGFTAAMFLGGPLCDWMGLKRMYHLAFLAHLSGILLTLFASGYWHLFFSTLLVGLGNGFVESASYTLVSSMYSSEKSKKINDWHIWFPGGIVIGGLLAFGLSQLQFGWRVQVAVMILPILVYGGLFYGQSFPRSERIVMGISNRAMVRACLSPLFIFLLLCMLLTAATELGTNQWIAELLATIGVPSILLLVFINGIMAIGRANAGHILKRVSPTGLLIISSILAFSGLFALGYAQGYTAFIAAGVFAAGICFYWPTLIGFVAEELPQTGPLGLSLMGGTGLMSTAIVLPYLGNFFETAIAAAQKQLLPLIADATQREAKARLTAGASTLQYVSLLPAVLIVAFTGLHFYQRSKHKSPLKPINL